MVALALRCVGIAPVSRAAGAASAAASAGVCRTEPVAVTMARQYGALSNVHALEAIGELLDESCSCYGNQGKEASLAGMANFRKTYPRVWWKFHSFDLVSGDANAAVFSFDRFWTGAGDGKIHDVAATEQVRVSEHTGLIVEIAHTVTPSEPAIVDRYPPEAKPLDFDGIGMVTPTVEVLVGSDVFSVRAATAWLLAKACAASADERLAEAARHMAGFRPAASDPELLADDHILAPGDRLVLVEEEGAAC